MEKNGISNNIKAMKPLVIAHRGASKEAPENSLASFKRALELHVDLIECDIHCSKDLVPVVIHDFVLKRTVTPIMDLAVKDLFLSELKTLDAGSWFSPDFSHERIPTLEEVLKLTNKLIIEVKVEEDQNDFPIITPLTSLLDRNPGCFVGSFSNSFLKEFQKIAPHIPLIGICDTLAALEQHLSLGIKIVSIEESLLSKELVSTLLQSHTKLYTWTVDSKSRFDALATYGVQGIITNDPRSFTQGLKIAYKSQIPAGKSLPIDLPSGRSLALFNIEGSFFAIDNACPHNGAPLCEGTCENFIVACPWHNWKFDVKTGKCINRADECVKTYPLIIQGEGIYLKN